MPDILFYHLTEKTLADTLPGLLEKSQAKGWRCVVQLNNQITLDLLDRVLWTNRADSFLAHSSANDESAKEQPIWLTLDEQNPNEAQIRFMVDGATPPDLSTYERGVYIFDGHNESAVSHARERWKAEKAAGHNVTYWKQNSEGGLDKKA
ncbi:MAG: DNA polymerase III subunit chi [Nitratireductor sp.]